jgi:hypothetical protein
MFVTGLGVGPTFAVFTLIVQNSVPVERLGTATSNLTFFQSVGGTIGLAITGTIFGSTLAAEAPRQLVAAGIPPDLAAAGGGQLDAATAVGDLGAAILAQVPEAFRAQVEPFIPAIVDAIHQAVSIATASTFYVGVAASLLAALLVAGLKEVRMRDERPVTDSGHERVGNDHPVAAPGA